METQINMRVKEILDHTALTPSEFSSEVGISRSNLAHILSGRNQPGFAMLEKILMAFPQIRAEWLITGMGNMLKSEAELEELRAAKEKKNSPAPSVMELPFDEAPDTQDDMLISATSSENPTSETVVPSSQPATRKSGRSLRNTLVNNNGKKVKKIVYFYMDNSFEEYFPL